MDFNLLNIYTDGGARGNPGPAACAFVVQDEMGKKIFSQGKYLGNQTNNFAEYQGVLFSLDWLQNFSQNNQIFQIKFHLDSLLVVNQLKLIYRIKEPTLISLHHEVILRLTKLNLPHLFIHIPREFNAQADALVNETLDLPRTS